MKNKQKIAAVIFYTLGFAPALAAGLAMMFGYAFPDTLGYSILGALFVLVLLYFLAFLLVNTFRDIHQPYVSPFSISL